MDPATLGVLASAVITAITGVVVATIARSANRGATTVEFAKAVVARLEKVEDDLDGMKTQLAATTRALHAAVRFIDQLFAWGRAGGVSRPPTPPHDLREWVDTSAWNVD